MEVERVRKLACWCIQDNEFERPTMSEAVQIHRGVLEVNMPPNSKTNPSQNFELSKTVALVKRDRRNDDEKLNHCKYSSNLNV